MGCERIPVCVLWRRGDSNVLSRDFVRYLVIKKVWWEAELFWPGHSSLNAQWIRIHQKAGAAVAAGFLFSFGDGASLVLFLYSRFSLQGLQDWLNLQVHLLPCLPCETDGFLQSPAKSSFASAVSRYDRRRSGDLEGERKLPLLVLFTYQISWIVISDWTK